MRRILFILLALAIAAEAEEPRVIPCDLSCNAIWFKATVNGSRPLDFLFDTAAGGFVLNRSVIGELKLPVLSEFDQPNAGSGDNPTHISRIPGVSAEIGGARLDFPSMVAIPLAQVENSFGRGMDAIIGRELMERYVARIDYDARTLTLLDPKEFRYSGPGAVVPLEIRGGVPVVRATFGLPGRDAVEGEFLVDAPYPGSVLFATPFVLKHDLLPAVLKLVPRLMDSSGGAGVGGTLTEASGRLEWLQLGPFRLDLPTAAFAKAKAGAFARTDIAGIIGGEVLRRFRVTMDFPGRRMILEPNAHLKEPFDYDASGLRLKTRCPRCAEIEVARVVDGTPASEAGIQVGDRVLEADGKPSALWSVCQLRAAFKKLDREYAIKLQRGTEVLTVKLKTRRLL